MSGTERWLRDLAEAGVYSVHLSPESVADLLVGFGRLRARVAELEAAGSVSPDDAHTTETHAEWRVTAITPQGHRSAWDHDAQQSAHDHAAHLRRWRWDGVRVESRTVSTTTRTTDWKANER